MENAKNGNRLASYQLRDLRSEWPEWWSPCEKLLGKFRRNSSPTFVHDDVYKALKAWSRTGMGTCATII